MNEKNTVVELTAEIVAAYVTNNPVAQSDLPKLIGEVYYGKGLHESRLP